MSFTLLYPTVPSFAQLQVVPPLSTLGSIPIFFPKVSLTGMRRIEKELLTFLQLFHNFILTSYSISFSSSSWFQVFWSKTIWPTGT
jgi:hypothetical protein